MTIVDINAGELLAGAYDAPFDDTTGVVLRTITANSTTGIVARRIEQINIEAQRLVEAGDLFKPDNPVVRALIADLLPTMAVNAALMNSAGADVTLIGAMAGAVLARALSLPGLTDDDLVSLGIPWVGLDPNEIAAAIGYIESEAWIAFMEQYAVGTVDQIDEAIIMRIADRWGPRRIARDIKTLVEGLPASNARQALRTLQLVSSRDAQVMQRVANRDILEYQIRIAALDNRTCMACVALHGQILPIDARIDDHHNGRCTSVTKVRGFPVPDVESGAEWFGNLSESQQTEQMGKAAFNAYKAGAVAVDDFVMPYTDDVFGSMIGAHSLTGILGDKAKDYK